MNENYHPKNPLSKRNLPHWQATNGVYAIVFRLAGSLPKSVIVQLQKERNAVKQALLQEGLPSDIIKVRLARIQRFYFGKFDTLLEENHKGPHYLKEPAVAKIVADSIMHFNNKRYKVIDYCIMSNHVHLTFYKLTHELGEVLGSIKKYTARQINLLHNCVGRKVWLAESYDHLVRDRGELAFYHTYALENAVMAKIVTRWEDHPYTYAQPDFEAFYQPELLSNITL